MNDKQQILKSQELLHLLELTRQRAMGNNNKIVAILRATRFSLIESLDERKEQKNSRSMLL